MQIATVLATMTFHLEVTLLLLVDRGNPLFASSEGLVVVNLEEGGDNYRRIGTFTAYRKIECRQEGELTLY
jgi:hypothetical protein